MNATTFPTANQAAFFTISALAAATVGSTVAAAMVASKVAIVAYAILATTCAAVSIASITAYFATTSNRAGDYFHTIADHATKALPAMYQYVAQTLFQHLIQGIGKAIEITIVRAFTGDSCYRGRG